MPTSVASSIGSFDSTRRHTAGRLFVGALLASALLLLVRAPRAAHAQTTPAADPAGEAQQAFERGTARLDARDAAGALAEFDRALALVDSPNARLYRARALTELQRWVEAAEAYERTARDAGSRAQTEPRFAATRTAALEELRRVEPHVARIVVRVNEAPPGLRVTVAGRELAADQLGAPVAVQPGAVDVVVAAQGRPERRQTTTVAAGRSTTVQIAISESAVAATSDRVQSGDTDAGGAATVASRRIPTPFLVASIASFGVGAASFVLSGVFFGAASGRYAQLERDCGMGPCPESMAGAVDEGRALQTWTNVWFALGVTGVAAGGALLTVGILQSRRARTTVAWSPFGVALRGAF